MLGLGSIIPQKDAYFSTDIFETIKALCNNSQDDDTISISEKLAAFNDIIVPNFRINNSTSFFDHCCDLSNLPQTTTSDFYETASTLFKLGASRVFFSQKSHAEIARIYNGSMKIDAIEHADTIIYVLYQLGIDLNRVLLKTCQLHGDKQTIKILLQYIDFEQGELAKLTTESLNHNLENLSLNERSKKNS